MLSDDGHKVYAALRLLTWHPTVVQFLDETKEGKELLEALYLLRDNKELYEQFQVYR